MATHGLKGAVYVRSYSHDAENLIDVPSLSLGLTSQNARSLPVLSCTPFKEGVLLALAGVATIDEARLLLRHKVWLDESQFQDLQPGAIYVKDLIGATLSQADGSSCGKVTNVEDTGFQSILTISVEARGKTQVLDIPFCSVYFGAWDQQKRALEVRNLDEYLEGWL